MATTQDAKVPPGEPWEDLFDPSAMEHACDALRDAIATRAGGATPPLMHVPLRRFVIEPAERYAREHWKPGKRYAHVEAAEGLVAVAQRLAERFADAWPFEQDDAAAEVDKLRTAWLLLIAHGAGSSIYHDLPRQRAQRRAAASRPRGRAVKFTAEICADRVKAAGLSGLTEALAAELAAEFRIGERTVYRRQADARRLGLLPLP